MSKRLDAVLFDSTVSAQFAKENEGKLQVIDSIKLPHPEGSGMSVVVANESEDLLKVVNDVIASVGEDQFRTWVEDYIGQIE